MSPTASSGQNPSQPGADPSRDDLLAGQRRHRSTARPRPPLPASPALSPALGNVARRRPPFGARDRDDLVVGHHGHDPERTNLVSGTASIASGFLAGDTLATTTTGTSITASYNDSTGVLSPQRQRYAWALPAGARQCHLRVEQPEPDQLRRRSGAERSPWLVNDGTLNIKTETTTVTISINARAALNHQRRFSLRALKTGPAQPGRAAQSQFSTARPNWERRLCQFQW